MRVIVFCFICFFMICGLADACDEKWTGSTVEVRLSDNNSNASIYSSSTTTANKSYTIYNNGSGVYSNVNVGIGKYALYIKRNPSYFYTLAYNFEVRKNTTIVNRQTSEMCVLPSCTNVTIVRSY